MKIYFFVLSLIFFMSSDMAEGKSNHHGHTKSLGAHEHGAIRLEMAIVGNTIDVELDGPAEAFLGFEYIPKSEKEKKTFKDAEFLWKKDLLTKLIVLDKKLGCTSTEVSFIQELEEKAHKHTKKESAVHSEIEAKAKIICSQNLVGQSAWVSVKKHYPLIKKLSIDVVGSETKSYKAKNTEEIKL